MHRVERINASVTKISGGNRVKLTLDSTAIWTLSRIIYAVSASLTGIGIDVVIRIYVFPGQYAVTASTCNKGNSRVFSPLELQAIRKRNGNRYSSRKWISEFEENRGLCKMHSSGEGMSGRRTIVFFAIGVLSEPSILRLEARTMRSESEFRIQPNIQMSDYCRDWNKSNSDGRNEWYKSEIQNSADLSFSFHIIKSKCTYII